MLSVYLYMDFGDYRDEYSLNQCLVLASLIRSNLKIINNKAPRLPKELFEFINNVYGLEAKWLQPDKFFLNHVKYG